MNKKMHSNAVNKKHNENDRISRASEIGKKILQDSIELKNEKKEIKKEKKKNDKNDFEQLKNLKNKIENVKQRKAIRTKEDQDLINYLYGLEFIEKMSAEDLLNKMLLKRISTNEIDDDNQIFKFL